jgi:MFS family permease
MIRTPTFRDYFGISIFWLAISFFWGAMLFVVVQSRVSDIVAKENPALARTISVGERKSPPATAAEKQAGTEAGQKMEARVAARLSWLVGVGALVATVTQLLFGAISDNFRGRAGRRKPFIVAGTLLSTAAIALFPFVETYAALFAVFLLIQVCINVATGPYQALLPDLIPLQYHGTASAWMGLWQLVGRTGGMVAGALLLQSNAGVMILCITFLVLLNALMLLTVLMTREQPFQTVARAGIGESLSSIFRMDFLSHPSFNWVLVSRFVINTGIYTVFPFLQYYLINTFRLSKGDALQQQAMIALLVNIAGMAATFPAGMASDRFSKKSVVYVTCVVSMIGGLAFALSGSVAQALVAAAVFGAGYGAFQAVDWALVCNVLPPGEPAKYMGVWGIADCVPQMVGPMVGGAVATWAISQYGSGTGYRIVMVSAIVWFLLGTVAIRWVKERTAPSPLEAPPEPATVGGGGTA